MNQEIKYLVLLTEDDTPLVSDKDDIEDTSICIFSSVETAQRAIEELGIEVDAGWFTLEEIKDMCQKNAKPPVNFYTIDPEYNQTEVKTIRSYQF